jgi:hypothetical protein
VTFLFLHNTLIVDSLEWPVGLLLLMLMLLLLSRLLMLKLLRLGVVDIERIHVYVKIILIGELRRRNRWHVELLN